MEKLKQAAVEIEHVLRRMQLISDAGRVLVMAVDGPTVLDLSHYCEGLKVKVSLTPSKRKPKQRKRGSSLERRAAGAKKRREANGEPSPAKSAAALRALQTIAANRLARMAQKLAAMEDGERRKVTVAPDNWEKVQALVQERCGRVLERKAAGRPIQRKGWVEYRYWVWLADPAGVDAGV